MHATWSRANTADFTKTNLTWWHHQPATIWLVVLAGNQKSGKVSQTLISNFWPLSCISNSLALHRARIRLISPGNLYSLHGVYHLCYNAMGAWVPLWPMVLYSMRWERGEIFSHIRWWDRHSLAIGKSINQGKFLTLSTLGGPIIIVWMAHYQCIYSQISSRNMAHNIPCSPKYQLKYCPI